MNLMPLSGKGLWEAEIMTPSSMSWGGRQVGDCRGGQDTHASDVNTGGGQARTDGVVEELSGGAGVAPHDGAGAAAARAAGGGRVLGQDARRSLTELHGQGGCEQVVGQATYAVGSEETSHGNPPEGVTKQPHPATGRTIR